MAINKRKKPTARKPARKAVSRKPSAPTARDIAAQEKANQQAYKDARDKSLMTAINGLEDGKYELHVNRLSSKAEYLLVEAPKLSKCDEAALTQPHFTALAQDNFTPDLLRQWIRMAEQSGVTSREKIADAYALLKTIEAWRTANPLRVKTPD